MNEYRVLVFLSTIFIILGSYSYFKLFRDFRVLREQRTISERLVDLISHVPDPKAGPGPHIFAGVTLIFGIALAFGTIVADVSSEPEDFLSYVISLSSLIVGTLFSAISLWTLWQTRRLEYQAGYKIFDFHHLIIVLNKELDNLLSSLRNYQKKPQPFHRVYLVTTQPFLGMLTYPNSKETSKFESSLFECARLYSDLVLEFNNNSIPRMFEFQVICGDKSAISEFHKKYFTANGTTESKLADLDDTVEIKIKQMNELARTQNKKNKITENLGPFLRMDHVPKVQYMIIGNKLFEFTLESGNSLSEIFNTQVVSDSRYCNAYIENFKILLKAFMK